MAGSFIRCLSKTAQTTFYPCSRRIPFRGFIFGRHLILYSLKAIREALVGVPHLDDGFQFETQECTTGNSHQPVMACKEIVLRPSRWAFSIRLLPGSNRFPGSATSPPAFCVPRPRSRSCAGWHFLSHSALGTSG